MNERISFESADETIIDSGFLADFDVAFDSLTLPTPKSQTKVTNKTKMRERAITEVRVTYLAVASEHLKPTLRYLKAIQKGLASRDLCDIVHYVVGPLIGKTRKVGLAEETKALIGFQRELKKILADRSHRVTTEQRDRLAEAFVPVSRAFDLDYRGHSTAVFNLLGFYKAVKRATELNGQDLKKLFGIGIPSLTMLRTCSIAELVSLSGISEEKAALARAAAREFQIA